MKAVELFSGNADITKALNKSGIKTISVDYDTKKMRIYMRMCMVSQLRSSNNSTLYGHRLIAPLTVSRATASTGFAEVTQ